MVGNSNGSLGFEAFKWTEDAGTIGLGDLPGGSFESQLTRKEQRDRRRRGYGPYPRRSACRPIWELSFHFQLVDA